MIRTRKKKVVVVGLDGMSPELFDVLIEKKIFAFLGKLRSKGNYTSLQSVCPPVTAPAWTTFATGVNPGKHGIFNFLMLTKSLLSMMPVSSSDIAVLTFYEQLNRHQKKSILINLPVSWPPLTKNPTITSLLTQEDNPIYPRSLLKKVPALENYYITPESFNKGRPYPSNTRFINAVRRIEKVRFDSALGLMNLDWDLFFVLFSGTDWLSHRFYSSFLDGSAKKEIWQFFREIDFYVGKIYERVRKEADFFVISDHGFQSINYQFAVNQWLAEQNFLKRSLNSRFYKKGEISSFPSFVWLARSLLQSRFLVSIYEKIHRCFSLSMPISKIIAVDNTVAFSDGWGIYINSRERFVDGIVSSSQEKLLARKIRDSLKKIRDPRDGKRIFKNVFLREEVYSGKEIKKMPNIILVPNESWQITAGLAMRQTFSYYKRNDHSRNGIFLALGPNIQKREIRRKVALEDVPAMVLYLLGEELPKYLDGKIVHEILKK